MAIRMELTVPTMVMTIIMRKIAKLRHFSTIFPTVPITFL